METLFFVLCLFLSVEGALSQETGKLYTTLSDLLNETSSSTLNVIKEKRNKKQLFMSGGGDFKIYNGDKELDKEIKKKTFAIEIDDTLYINCIGLKFKKRPIGAWFAPGLICKGQVYFTAIPTGSNAAMAFGVVGAAVQSANAASSRVFYEVDDSTYISRRFRKKAEIRQGGFEKNGRIITKISGIAGTIPKRSI